VSRGSGLSREDQGTRSAGARVATDTTGSRIKPWPVSQVGVSSELGRAALFRVSRICRGFQPVWRAQTRAARAAACGAAAEVPANGRGRQLLGKGTVATNSGFVPLRLGPHAL